MPPRTDGYLVSVPSYTLLGDPACYSRFGFECAAVRSRSWPASPGFRAPTPRACRRARGPALPRVASAHLPARGPPRRQQERARRTELLVGVDERTQPWLQHRRLDVRPPQHRQQGGRESRVLAPAEHLPRAPETIAHRADQLLLCVPCQLRAAREELEQVGSVR